MRRLDFESKQSETSKGRKKRALPPDGTKCRFHAHEGEIVKKRLVVGDNRYQSFSGACKGLAGMNVNGWDHWKIQLPDTSEWILAKDWRERDMTADHSTEEENDE